MQVRLLILFALLLVIDWYAFQAVRHLSADLGRNSRLIIYSLFWSVPAITILFTVASVNGWTDQWPRNLRIVLTSAIFILYFSKFLMGVVLLLDDIRRLIMWIASGVSESVTYSAGRSDFLTKFSLLAGAVPFASLTYGMVRNPYRYKVFEEDIPVHNLPDALDGFRIVQISDIHSGSFLLKEPVKRSVEMINSLKPDVAFFTGDLVNTKADEVDGFIDVFSAIEAKHGVYSILGNHDYGDYHEWPNQEAKEQNFRDLLQKHRDLGWDLLMNEHRVVESDGARIGIIGVENYSTFARFPKYGDLDKATAGMDPTDVNILLSHDPSHWEEFVGTRKDIDLTLSGHTHGFQFGVEIPGFVRWSPVQYVYKRWAGLYREGEQFLYVNRGLGYLGYPGRVGILPEITLLTLRKAA